MSTNTVYNTRPIFCNYCNKSNAVARVTEVVNESEIISQAKWICPLCNNVVKVAELGRKPKK